MPSDFLLPLFALTLLANAVLVAVAIRGLRRGRFDPDHATARDGSPLAAPASVDGDPWSIERPASRDQPLTEELRRAIASRRAILDDHSAPADEDQVPVAREPEPAEPAASGAPSSGVIVDAAALPSSPAPTAPHRRPPTKTVAASRNTAARAAGPSGRARGGRRRFALPPMNDDHERVSRSIETFLGGSVAIDGPPSTDAVATGATTVALIAVDGLPPRPRRSKANRSGVDEEAAAAALAMVERTIRSAARGSDVVSAVDRGRYRVVLPATGELAARAYLRRIRATVEPLLESAERPLRLAVATATVLDEPIADAVRRAERRLSAALAIAKTAATASGEAGPEVVARAALDAEPEPRAAPD